MTAKIQRYTTSDKKRNEPMLQRTKPTEERTGHNATKLEPKEGPKLWIGEGFSPAGPKVRTQDMSFPFTKRPSHREMGCRFDKHRFAEFFYVLEGKLDFWKG
jgi:hypothetical protein